MPVLGSLAGISTARPVGKSGPSFRQAALVASRAKDPIDVDTNQHDAAPDRQKHVLTIGDS